nr:hypothetical protein [Nocardioides aquaticus]
MTAKTRPDDPWVAPDAQFPQRTKPVVPVQNVAVLVVLDRDEAPMLTQALLQCCELLVRERRHHLVRLDR